MKVEFCKKRNCPFLGKMNEGAYGLRETPYCEFAPETIWGDRRIKRMKQCPNAEKMEKQMEKQINLKMTISYDDEKETINSYGFCGEYTAGEVAVIIATLKHCLRDWGFKVTLDEE